MRAGEGSRRPQATNVIRQARPERLRAATGREGNDAIRAAEARDLGRGDGRRDGDGTRRAGDGHGSERVGCRVGILTVVAVAHHDGVDTGGVAVGDEGGLRGWAADQRGSDVVAVRTGGGRGDGEGDGAAVAAGAQDVRVRDGCHELGGLQDRSGGARRAAFKVVDVDGVGPGHEVRNEVDRARGHDRRATVDRVGVRRRAARDRDRDATAIVPVARGIRRDAAHGERRRLGHEHRQEALRVGIGRVDHLHDVVRVALQTGKVEGVHKGRGAGVARVGTRRLLRRERHDAVRATATDDRDAEGAGRGAGAGRARDDRRHLQVGPDLERRIDGAQWLVAERVAGRDAPHLRRRQAAQGRRERLKRRPRGGRRVVLRAELQTAAVKDRHRHRPGVRRVLNEAVVRNHRVRDARALRRQEVPDLTVERRATGVRRTAVVVDASARRKRLLVAALVELAERDRQPHNVHGRRRDAAERKAARVQRNRGRGVVETVRRGAALHKVHGARGVC